VERAIKMQVRARNYVALYEVKAAEELRTAEMAILTQLEAKYRLAVGDSTEAMPKVSIEAQSLDAQPLSTPVSPFRGASSRRPKKGNPMRYSVYYRGEISINPPLSEEHAAAVLAFSKKSATNLPSPSLRGLRPAKNPICRDIRVCSISRKTDRRSCQMRVRAITD
jgi:hypothetical protein